MKKSKKVLLVLIAIAAVCSAIYVFSHKLNNAEEPQPPEAVAPKTIAEIEQLLSKQTGVSNITVAHNKKMLVYNKLIDKVATSYLWRINELNAIELIKHNGEPVGIFFSKNDQNLIISEQINNEVKSHLINTTTGQISEKQLISINTPIWSPTEDIFAVLTQKESVMYLKIFYSDFKEFQTVTKTAPNQSYQLLSWDQDNTINYLVINEDSSITRSYDYSRKIYDILGNSNKLSQRNWHSMLNWRNVSVAKARYNAKDLFINGNSKIKKISLTFDDGPDKINTAKILDILKKYNVKASFFIVGNKAEKDPELVERMYNEGHLVLNHSYNHANYEYKTAEQINADILKTQDIINNILGVKPLLIRTPYGVVNDKIFNVVRGINHKIILWSIDTLDWSQKEASNIIKNTLDNARAGEIVLFHSENFSTETVKALPTIIEKLVEQGFDLVDVAELLKLKAYQ